MIRAILPSFRSVVPAACTRATFAASLGIPQVIVPAHPGVLSAWGMAVADIVKTYSQGLPGLLRSAVLDQARSVLQA